MFPNCLHYNQICRICFASSDELIQIFNYEDGSIVKILMSLATISINNDDGLPQNVCQFCLHQVKSLHYFVLKCQESDKKLRISLANSKKSIKNRLENEVAHCHDIASNEVSDFYEDHDADTDISEDIKIEQPKLVLDHPTSVKNEQRTNRKRVKRRNEEKKNYMDGSDTGNETKEYHCLKCRKEFTSNELLLNHISKQHPNITEEISTGNKKTIKSQTICGICNKNFANRKNLERHRLIHEREKTQKVCKCHICGKEMKHINHLNVHMRTHRDSLGNPIALPTSSNQEKKKFPCTVCGNNCSSKSNLAVHMRRHSGEMTNFCSVCGKGYPRSTDLVVHLRKHTGERPFVCNVHACNRSFARSDKLAIHMRTHTGEKPFACNSCGRAFAQSNDLASHRRRNACGAVSISSNNEKIDEIS